MERTHARHVVVGAGAMGSAAAYQLARRGESVLLIEQFAPGHARGSSHGAARITRHSYADPLYARLMPRAFAAWRRLEADAGRSFYIRTGGVSFGPPGVDYVARVAANLDAIGVANRRMSGRDLNRAHPAFAVPDDYDAVFEPDAGLVEADSARAAMLEQADRLGAGRFAIWPDCTVRRIDLEADRPTLETDRGLVVADRLVVAAGAWTGALVPGLAGRLRPTHQQVMYLSAGAPEFALGRMPVFIFKGPGELDAFYGMPGVLGTGVKVARHGGPDADPDADRPMQPEGWEPVRAFLRGHLPALAGLAPDREEACLYTVTPDDHFVLGPLPGRADVVVASPCSGHGFKFAALVGELLADLVTSGTTDVDLAAWSPAGVRSDQ